MVEGMEDRRATTLRLFDEAGRAADGARLAVEDEIIRVNMAVASDCARRYRGRGIAADDLEQVAYLGLVKAVRGFDPERGPDFLAYAVPTIRGELRRHFRDLGWTLRPPRSIQELQTRILAVESDPPTWRGTSRSTSSRSSTRSARAAASAPPRWTRPRPRARTPSASGSGPSTRRSRTPRPG
jgi:RNA polymerase sigma factor (sigma-70 family)